MLAYTDDIINCCDIDFLLPNGRLMQINFNRNSTLNEIRSELFRQIKIEGAHIMKSANQYIFTSVNEEGELVEFYEYDRKFSELRLFPEFAFFKLIENEFDNVNEKLTDLELNNVCGINISDIKLIKDEEIIEYRLELFRIVRDRLLEEIRLNSIESNLAAFESMYSPNIEIDSNQLKFHSTNTPPIKPKRSSHPTGKRIKICIFDIGSRLAMKSIILDVLPELTPVQVIAQLRAQTQEQQEFVDCFGLLDKYTEDELVLNICGCDEIIYGQANKIGSYKYIHKCLSTNKLATFFLSTKEKIKSNLVPSNSQLILPVIDNIIGEIDDKIKNNLIKKKNISWKSNSLEADELFSFYLDYLSYYPTSKEIDKIFIRAAIYHGQDRVGDEIDSDIIESDKIELFKHFLNFKQTMKFNVRISQLHRCAKLCLSLNSITKRRRSVLPIAWISLNIFDYKSCILSGKKSIHLWPAQPQKSFTSMCISSVTGQNPNKSFSLLKTEFFTEKDHFYYPTSSEIIRQFNRFSHYQSQDELMTTMPSSLFHDDCLDMTHFGNSHELDAILGKDSLAELTEQDKIFLWSHRYDCIRFPNSLPKLLHTVDWSSRKSVVEIYSLINEWPTLKPNVAIELLNSNFFDTHVRSFAVKCLDKHMKNEDVQSYLLQLVQAIKTEHFYNNDLVKFLLKRAFQSQRLGLELYWSLKSEMKNAAYKYRFGIILEAYCRGIGDQLQSLVKQLDVIDNLSAISNFVKQNKENLNLITGSYIQEELETYDQRKILSNFTSPTNRSYTIGSIDPYKCKILSSAKRPLYLSWLNNTSFAELFDDMGFDLIFKNGDDLRQDMLTIQILKLMNTIWNNEGLNLNMLLYDVISTGYNIGFIEVIKNSVTIFKIQTLGGTRSQFQLGDKYQLYKWIEANNPDKKDFDEAIENFTRSCAGFCVATFVLGIGDRHPDNIMINKQGKLFHIDFGHFLGHFKTKYGFKRERVPFVLPSDFTVVISKGSANPEHTLEFKRFRILCEHAFMIIRKYSHFIINLFTLMISSGMPELQSNEDVMYLRNHLAIDEGDERARKFFSDQFDSVLKLAYTTKLDWAFHAMNKTNRL